MKTPFLVGALVCAAQLAAPLAAQVPPIPIGLQPGDSYRLLFVTDGTRDATSVDVTDYDAFVTGQAAVGLSTGMLNTSWRALVSTPTVSARDHAAVVAGGSAVPVYGCDGVRIADDYGDLWTSGSVSLLSLPNVNQDGLATADDEVWTGSLADGTSAGVNALGGSSPLIMRGNPQQADTSWITGTAGDPTEARALYAISALLRVPECGLEHVVGFGFPGIDGLSDDGANCVQSFDPDGAGPLPRQLLFGGDFQWTGEVSYNGFSGAAPGGGLAAWDPSNNDVTGFGTFGPLMEVRDTAVRPDGRVFLIGDGVGSSDPEVLQWNGTEFEEVAAPGSPSLRISAFTGALLALPNGDIVAGPLREDPAIVQIDFGIGRWNGTSWSWVGGFLVAAPNSEFRLEELVQLTNGDLIAAGGFSQVDADRSALPTSATPANNIARWDGAAWQPLGAGCNGTVRSVEELPNGDLLVGGDFTMAGGVAADHVARWDGSAWHAIPHAGGLAFGDSVHEVGILPNGDLVAAGAFSLANGAVADRVARHDGASWTQIGSGIQGDVVRDFEVLPDGRLFAVGRFAAAGDRACVGGAVWNGAFWDAISHGPNALSIFDMSSGADGTLHVLGRGPSLGGAVMFGDTRVARLQGGDWELLADPITGAASELDVFDDGRMLVCGEVWSGNDGRVLLWDGSTWSEAAPDINISRVVAAELMANGDVAIAGGDTPTGSGNLGGSFWRGFGYYDGSGWVNFSGGAKHFFGNSYDVAQLRDGRVLVVGQFAVGSPTAGRSIAIWDGAEWTPLADIVSGGGAVVTTCVEAPNGDIYVGGNFTAIDGVTCHHCARYDGSTWHALGNFMPGTNGPVTDVDLLPNGDLVAVGDFTFAGLVPALHLARWDGVVWQAIGEGADIQNIAGDRYELAIDRRGVITVATDGALARLEAPCGAAVNVLGGGCASSGGDNDYVADNLPWLGATFEATGSGLPPFSFTAIVTGLSPANAPLSLVLPQGQPGCTLLASPDLIDFQIPTPAGELQTSLMIPNDLSLVGQQLYRQLVPMEVNAQLQVLELTASDALELVIGAF